MLLLPRPFSLVPCSTPYPLQTDVAPSHHRNSILAVRQFPSILCSPASCLYLGLSERRFVFTYIKRRTLLLIPVIEPRHCRENLLKASSLDHPHYKKRKQWRRKRRSRVPLERAGQTSGMTPSAGLSSKTTNNSSPLKTARTKSEMMWLRQSLHY
jgi:hypothetical protein